MEAQDQINSSASNNFSAPQEIASASLQNHVRQQQNQDLQSKKKQAFSILGKIDFS